jgi:UDP-3-O-[3-hydroxymyristoyl] glucosamine N-acyltransferase LpxD
MFTGTTLHLNEFNAQFGIQVIRDCNFAYIGKVGTNLRNRIVPCGLEKHLEQAMQDKSIVGVICPKELSELVLPHLGVAFSENPVSSAYQLHEHLIDIPSFQWKGFRSTIHPTTIIHPGAYVAEHDVVIGAGVVVYPNAVILPRTVIGAGSTIGAGSVIGTDAFEVNISTSPRSILRQAGGVRIGTNVDIQAKCTIVRATFGGFTEIGDETKLDCQVHVAHDCEIGKKCMIAACAEISGRVKIGNDCFIGPNASISNGCEIGNGAHVTIGAVVTRSVLPGDRVSGNFAVPHDRWLIFIKSLMQKN